MTDDNLLSGNTDPGADANTDFLAELTRPGGKFDRTKYDSDEAMYKAMAEGKYKADMFIESKNRQYDDLYDDYVKLKEQHNAGASLQELLDQLKQEQQQNSSRDEHLNSNENKPAYDPKEIESLVSSQVQKLRQSEREDANFNQVREKLQNVLGSTYKESLKKQADDLGMSDEEVNALARKNPKLFYKTFGLDAQPQQSNFQAPPQTQVRTDISAAKRGDQRTLSYYENLRKKDPDLYFNPKTVIQMDKDAQALGEAFFDI